MGWVDELHGQVVGLDSAPLIYFIEDHPVYRPLVQPFFDALDSGHLHVVTSTLTLLEVLIQPLRQGEAQLADSYRSILLGAKGVRMIPITESIAEKGADLRATYNLSTPDALQVAAMMESGATAILTNDIDLKSLPGVELIVLDKLHDSPA